MHKLIIEDDEGKAVVVPLIRDEITIGRQEGNTIRLTEVNVSRRHARLLKRDGAYFIEDLSSYTGTKVNGVAIPAAVALKNGDQIVIGDYKLGIQVEGAAAAARSSGNLAAAVPAPPVPSPAAALAPPIQAYEPATSDAPEPMEGAPTVPLRPLGGEAVLPGAAAAAPPARMVVITTGLAGAEFLLDRASLVVGRTPENDIVLNHKSISRHHAKIIRDGNAYVVVDLESANGVRVNGAQQGRMDLSTGDVVELGHVRLRFISGDDHSGFDAEMFRVPNQNRNRLLIGGAAVAAIVTIGLFALSGGSEKSVNTAANSLTGRPAAPPAPPTPPAPEPAAAPATAAPTTAVTEPDPAAPATPTPATPTPVVPTPTGPQAEAAALLDKAKEALKQEKWADALDAATRAVALAPTSAEATELRRSIEAEKVNADHFETLKRAADRKNHEAVLATYNSIADDSHFKERARPMQQEATAKLVAVHLGLAEKRQSAGKCAEARKEADVVLALDATNQGAQAVIAKCSRPAPEPAAKAPPEPKPARPVAAARPARPARSAPSRQASNNAPAPRPAPAPAEAAGNPDDLVQEAQKAWLKGQYAAAIEASRKALRAQPGLARAYQIIAVCSCSLKDAESATRAYEKLDDKNKQMVRSLCQKSGVTIQ